MQTYSGNIGWSFVCAKLHDTTTSQRLEYCFRVWRSWSGPAYDAPIVSRNPHIGAGYTSIVTDLVAAGTRCAQIWAGAASTVAATQPSGNTSRGATTRTHLVNAINDANAKIKRAT